MGRASLVHRLGRARASIADDELSVEVVPAHKACVLVLRIDGIQVIRARKGRSAVVLRAVELVCIFPSYARGRHHTGHLTVEVRTK